MASGRPFSADRVSKLVSRPISLNLASSPKKRSISAAVVFGLSRLTLDAKDFYRR
nr:hypothetical protein [Escherichia coli]